MARDDEDPDWDDPEDLSPEDLLDFLISEADDFIDQGERTLVYVEDIDNAADQIDYELEKWDDEERYEAGAG